ncbi:MAG: patatin-like phospholipase family protein [Candidatus Omnitrophica bacterium]|nr:patatin-like phospholipase family protein [Candidatus Omnitrophota bacterium]
MRFPFRVGLCLGGGGARGLAHIGVLKVLEKEGIPIDLIAGTSMGAIIGGAFALHRNTERLEEVALVLAERKELFHIESISTTHDAFEESSAKNKLRRIADVARTLYFYNRQAARSHIMDSTGIEAIIRELVGDYEFKDTQIPFCAVSVDLMTGEEVLLSEGELARALLASASIPGILPPVSYGRRLLIDGGIRGAVPSDVMKKLHADLTIGVNTERWVERRSFKHGIDIVLQADSIKTCELNRVKLEACDIPIQPKLRHVSWAHFSKAEECIRRGEEATQVVLPWLKKLVAQRRRKVLFKRLITLRF